jgi:hypothetical protein
MTHAYENYSRESFYQFYRDYANGTKAFSAIYSEKFQGKETESEFSLNYFSLAFDALKLFPEFREKMILGLKNELKIWAEVIKNAREKGEIKTSMTDEELAQTFIYLSDGVAMHMIMRGSNIDELINPSLILWDKLYEQIKA